MQSYSTKSGPAKEMEKQALQQRNFPSNHQGTKDFPHQSNLSIYIGYMVDYIEIAREKMDCTGKKRPFPAQSLERGGYQYIVSTA